MMQEDIIDDSSEETDDSVQPSTSAGTDTKDDDEHMYTNIDTPKWRQFKNIERILQRAGIDTSSKTWLTLTRPGRHICPYCQRACSKPSVLEKHIRAHTGERPYPCGVCGFSFKTKSNLYKHCKSRAHTLKTNVEAKKLKAQSSTESNPSSVDLTLEGRGDNISSPVADVEKKKQEPAQRHVIQEVVKYLEKNREQRPSEVQTDRQRVKLERLRSIQDKWLGENKKAEEYKTLQRQLSLPVLPTKGFGLQFQKIAPKSSGSLDTPSSGEVKNIAQLLVPGTYLVNEKGEILQPVTPGDPGRISQPVSSGEETGSIRDRDSALCNRIEILNLPDPDVDPETSTKALHDLEELSEKFSKAAKDGLQFSTAVQSLPDKRVQVVLQLQHSETVKREKEGRMTEPSTPSTPVASRASISSTALKERIQRLISNNAAIVDTPKVEPPRAKCIRRNLSRQDSETLYSRSDQQTGRSETEASVSALMMPNIGTVPLQPLQQEGAAMIENQSPHEVRETQRGLKQPNQKIVVERMEYQGENIVIINNDSGDDSPGNSRIDKDEKFPVSSELKVPTSSNETERKVSDRFSRILRANLELPLKNTFLPAVTSIVMVPQTSLSPLQAQSSSTFSASKTTTFNPQSTSKPVPGQIGKMALKNLQMRSKSLSHISSPATPQTPVVSQGYVQVPSKVQQHFTVQTPGGGPVQYMVQTPGKALVQYAVQTPTAPQPPPQVAVHTQGQVQYVLQTPTTPVGQIVLPGTSTPLLLLGSISGQQVTATDRQVVYLQQQMPNESPVLVQAPYERVGSQQFVIPAQPVVLSQNVPIAASAPTVLTTTKRRASNTGSHVTTPALQSPLLVPSSQADPMKILSSIVSNTMNQQKLQNQTGTPTSQPKEIKIEIKIPPPQIPPPPLQKFGTSPASQQKNRPPLMRQDSVHSLQSPQVATGCSPIFRFKTVLASPQTPNRMTPTTSGMFRFQTAVPKVGQNTEITSSAPKTQQASAIKEYLLKGKTSEEIQNVLQSETLPRKVDTSFLQLLYKCPHCSITFKKKETLDLHILCYCKKKLSQEGEPVMQTGFPSSSRMQTDIVTKLFAQSKSETSKGNLTGLLKSINVEDSKEKSRNVKVSSPLVRSQSVIITPDGKSKPLDPSLIGGEKPGTPGLQIH